MTATTIAPETAPLSTTSPTAAGPIDDGSRQAPPAPELVDAINQVFALFRVNFHNQYYAAFSDTQLLNQTKKLWLDSLSRFTPNAILVGAKTAIEQSEYLPTLHKMIQFCQGDPRHYGLPDVHQAYVEACNASTPKTTYQWSHPAVYFAGRDSDWFFLSSNPEYIAYPVFKEHYQRWCERVLNGETLPSIVVKALPSDTATPLSKQENRARLQAMRKELKV